MTDKISLFDSDVPPATGLEHNISEFSVGEISGAVKRTLEGAFGRVRVRGEISRPNYHGSGHLYFTLKDADAAMDGVCWRGSVGKLGITLEEGMEVICPGRISSYPRSSKYQLVVEAVELAGEGDSGDELYDRAVALIASEGKASTSFIQRHLQIGYNRAARIIDQMESEGIVSAANKVGRREILIATH